VTDDVVVTLGPNGKKRKFIGHSGVAGFSGVALGHRAKAGLDAEGGGHPLGMAGWIGVRAGMKEEEGQ
jgi:hypothetical protein